MKRSAKYIVLGVIALLPILYIGLMQWLTYDMYSPWLTELKPKGSGSKRVVFITRGALQGWKLLFLIQHGDDFNKKIEVLGAIDDADGPHSLRRVVVSDDGSIVAVQSNVHYWTYAYDFSESKAYGLKKMQYWDDSNIDALKEIHVSIERLIGTHGGVGKELTTTDIWDFRKELSWLEWQRWRNLLKRVDSN